MFNFITNLKVLSNRRSRIKFKNYFDYELFEKLDILSL